MRGLGAILVFNIDVMLNEELQLHNRDFIRMLK